LQAGKGYQYSYVCGDNEAQSLFYVQSRGADGSVTAIYDLLIPDFGKNTVGNLRVQLKGSKNAEGVYAFTPVKTLKNLPKYKLNGIRAWGDLEGLEVNLSGSNCGSADSLGLWTKAPDSFTTVSEAFEVNVANRPLHLAEIHYANAVTVGRGLWSTNFPAGLGLTMAIAGPALPGDVAKTSVVLRVGSGHPLKEDRQIDSCADKVGLSHCFFDEGSTVKEEGTQVIELERINAAHSQKVAWTPLDFAPQYELAYYELLPGQRLRTCL